MDLYQLLVAYNPIFETELESKRLMLSFLNDYENPFSREQRAGHFTGSALLLNSDMQKFLLMHHTKLDLWLQPGGHCDGDDNVLRVAIREAKEESGIVDIEPMSSEILDLDVHLIPATAKEPAHYHYDVRFLLKTVGDDTLIQNEESKELRWIERDLKNAKDITMDKSVIRMIRKAFAN